MASQGFIWGGASISSEGRRSRKIMSSSLTMTTRGARDTNEQERGGSAAFYVSVIDIRTMKTHQKRQRGIASERQVPEKGEQLEMLLERKDEISMTIQKQFDEPSLSFLRGAC